MNKSELTDYQMRELRRIADSQGLFIEELRYPTLTVLESAGLVVRKPWHQNIAIRKVYVTPAGRDALEAGE